MILISTSEDDFSTVSVMCWLKYLKKDFIISNPHNNIEIEDIRISNDNLELNLTLENANNIKFNLNMLDSYWYRRGGILPMYLDSFDSMNVSDSLKTEINESVKEEKEILRRFIDTTLSKNLKNINKFEDNNLSKLEALSVAKDLGINIPDTYILTKKKNLKELLKKSKLIIKNFNPGAVSYETNFKGIVSEFTQEDLQNIPEKFAPTMFQVLIEKKYEIRSFYLNKKFYSSVIFSQGDDQTKIDFRNYNFEKPNRVSPFELPIKISDKLTQLCHVLKLNSGSFDLIVTQENEFVFLEVNPVGQFYQVSHPCNYGLEKIIAETL